MDNGNQYIRYFYYIVDFFFVECFFLINKHMNNTTEAERSERLRNLNEIQLPTDYPRPFPFKVVEGY